MNQAYITRRQAIAKVREATGIRVDECRARVNRLTRKTDGLREKVHRSAVNALIREMSAPPDELAAIRPISDKQRSRIAA